VRRQSEAADDAIDPVYGTLRPVFLRQLEYLVALDREQHFGRAAATCHVTQPTLSAGVRGLEAELGVPLVRRARTFEGFTPEGERILVWAQRTLHGLDGLTQEASRLRGGLEGALRIGAIPTSLPASTHLTARFRERHPRVTVRLQSMTSRQIAHGLAHGELDAGLTYLDNEPLPGVDALPLWRERLLLVVGADSPLAAQDVVPWRDAATLPLCLLTPDMQHRRIVDAAFAQAGVRPTPAVETNSVSTLVAHARTGLPGVTAHTWLTANPLPDGLLAVPLVDPEVGYTIGLVTAAEGQRAPIVAELLSLWAPFELDQRILAPISSVP
jgi:DNA-binding transcriptional LysR family regulator